MRVAGKNPCGPGNAGPELFDNLNSSRETMDESRGPAKAEA
ncbi:MAG: hypothetical protein JWQ71_2504 [Pedosphaera sp.]|nr:hypothetical protein [Pedosphaera sp.]